MVGGRNGFTSPFSGFSWGHHRSGQENLNKVAGLRTHTLVSVGSCLIMLVSSMYKRSIASQC